MPVTIKSIVVSLFLAQAAYGYILPPSPLGWIPRNDWTKAVCAMRWGSVATFDGVKCIQKPGNVISGDDFYTACKLYGANDGYGPEWEKGAGYRGTCS
ncbi:hypothetical protein FPANT_5336 [Fusarium pseudoanthophilum]|uniref:Uncharacterized protein n=1 Tax=Fusarium pseudoanthophilum TaxID=48495 RepID=A0A8H5UPB2_9HYPO|nr:hypothetical protein FPANT_5336 [Fusarium pseudoanthophilum]